MKINPYRGAPLSATTPISPYADSHDIVEVKGTALLSLIRAKTVLGVNHDEDDAYIDALVKGVVRQVERYCRIDAVKKGRQAYYRYMHWKVVLPYGPHGDITEIKHIDSDGNETILTADDYAVYGQKWKTLEKINKYGQLYVTYDSGFEDDSRPGEIEAACYQELSLQYKNRQDPDTPAMTSVNNLSIEARHLLAGIRRKPL